MPGAPLTAATPPIGVRSSAGRVLGGGVGGGVAALKTANAEMGLALSEDEIDYLLTEAGMLPDWAAARATV